MVISSPLLSRRFGQRPLLFRCPLKKAVGPFQPSNKLRWSFGGLLNFKSIASGRALFVVVHFEASPIRPTLWFWFLLLTRAFSCWVCCGLNSVNPNADKGPRRTMVKLETSGSIRDLLRSFRKLRPLSPRLADIYSRQAFVTHPDKRGTKSLGRSRE